METASKKRKVIGTPCHPKLHLNCFSQIQESAKTTWLITYTAASPDITPHMLNEVKIKCVECYTTTWRESKYALIHMHYLNKIRSSVLKNAMQQLNEQYGVRSSTITGYDSIAGSNAAPVEEHPGFMRIVSLLNERSDELKSWLQKGDVFSTPTGILWNHIEQRDPTAMSRKQLIERVRQLAPLAKQCANLKAAKEALETAHEVMEAELNARLIALVEENKRLFANLYEMVEECRDLKARLGDEPALRAIGI